MVTIEEALAELALAKTNEQNAKARRIEVEEKVFSLIDMEDKERKTVKASNGLTVTVQTGFNYKLDKEYPDDMPVRTKVEFDKAAYNKLRDSDPDKFRIYSEYVTATPKKPSITLKVG